MKTKTAYTFGVIAKIPDGTWTYVSQVGKYVTEKVRDEAILEIAKLLHRAPCAVFIDAENDSFFEKPIGLYGEWRG